MWLFRQLQQQRNLVHWFMRHLHKDSLSQVDHLSIPSLHLQWQWQTWIILMSCQLH